MLNYLETAAQNCKTSYMKAILLRFVLRYNYRVIPCLLSSPLISVIPFRFQMEMLHKEEEEKKEIMLTNILSTIAAAYSTTCEAESNDHFLVGKLIFDIAH